MIEPIWNKHSQRWIVTVNGQLRTYIYYDEALQALIRAA